MTFEQTFDEYCEEHEIKPGEEGAAFGAYLNDQAKWNGTIEIVTKERDGVS